MASAALRVVPQPSPSSSPPVNSLLRPPPPPTPHRLVLRAGAGGGRRSRNAGFRRPRRLTGGGEWLPEEGEGEGEGEEMGFHGAVALFNAGDYRRCHDVVEELWYGAEEPARTLLHGVLQCAVGFHHLFNQNHRGAMMELGEGLCKLRKLGFDEGPFARFEQEIAAALEFIYQTQKELAACTEELCLVMDGSESSYRLLGNFAAGQQLYSLDDDADGVSHIIFSATNHYSSKSPLKVKVPALHATEEDLRALQYKCEYL